MTKRDILFFFFKWKKTIFTLSILVVFSVTLFVYVSPVQYTGKAKVLVEPNRAPAMRTDLSPGMQLGEASYTEAEIVLSYAVMAAVVDKLKPYARAPKKKSAIGNLIKSIKTKMEDMGLLIHMEPRDMWIRNLLKNVKVDPVMNSNILGITYKDTDPEWAALVVNEVIDFYIQHHFQVYVAVGNSKVYKAPMESSEKLLEEKQRQLVEFKNKNSIAAIKEKKVGLAQSISSLRSKSTNFQVNLAELEGKYQPGHPGYKQVVLMKSKIKQLSASIAVANRRLNKLEVKIDQVNTLEQEILSIRRTYEEHKRKYENARIAEFSGPDLINVRIVDYSPVPVRPDHSNLFFIAISIAAGFIFAVTVAFIREYFDSSVSEPAEIERILGIPEIGSLGKFGRTINLKTSIFRARKE
jgi:uncharacterized protein involved in exopolysaccharide biosynthesis